MPAKIARAVFLHVTLRRDYSHSQDAGQQRSFFVKLIGEGVFDNGGPYRAVVSAACGEEPAGPLQFLQPCPNAENNTGSNRDVMVFNANMASPSQQRCAVPLCRAVSIAIV